MWPSTSTSISAQQGPVTTPGARNSSLPMQSSWGSAQPPLAEVILQTRGLTKAYGKRFAVRCLDMEVRRGDVFGFLGPNGAGKTTTIRMLLNLVKPTFGEIKLFGENLEQNASRLLPRVGALVEQPAFQAYLSAMDNLTAIGGYTGGVSPRRVEEVLEIVGLRDRGRDRYSTYSSGMRQRLGIAAALLTDPELIILDEPGNSLDPGGLVEMRVLIRRLAQMGKTVLVSSHILSEVRQVCTRIGIIRGGQIIAAGPVDELLRSTSRWEVDVANPEEARRLMASVPVVRSVSIENNLLIIDAPTMHGRDLIYYLARNGFWPESVVRREDDLEQFFLRLTAQEKRS